MRAGRGAGAASRSEVASEVSGLEQQPGAGRQAQGAGARRSARTRWTRKVADLQQQLEKLANETRARRAGRGAQAGRSRRQHPRQADPREDPLHARARCSGSRPQYAQRHGGRRSARTSTRCSRRSAKPPAAFGKASEAGRARHAPPTRRAISCAAWSRSISACATARSRRATGPAGPAGPARPAGSTRPAGPAGSAGPAGPTGSARPAGPARPAGSAGPAGPAGSAVAGRTERAGGGAQQRRPQRRLADYGGGLRTATRAAGAAATAAGTRRRPPVPRASSASGQNDAEALRRELQQAGVNPRELDRSCATCGRSTTSGSTSTRAGSRRCRPRRSTS